MFGKIEGTGGLRNRQQQGQTWNDRLINKTRGVVPGLVRNAVRCVPSERMMPTCMIVPLQVTTTIVTMRSYQASNYHHLEASQGEGGGSRVSRHVHYDTVFLYVLSHVLQPYVGVDGATMQMIGALYAP